LTKLQHDYDESLANCAQLTQTLDAQNEEIATLKTQQQTESREEFENTHKEQVSALENELKIATKRFEDQTIELSSEINRLQQLLDEQMNKSNQYEEELKEKYSQLDNQRLQIQTSQEMEVCSKVNLLVIYFLCRLNVIHIERKLKH
jgi:chromosome segregation ATPase